MTPATSSPDSVRGVAAMVVVAVIAVVPLLAMPLLLGTIVDEMGISTRQAGFIVAAEMAGATLSALGMVSAITRVNWKLILLAGFAAMFVANVMFASAEEFGLLTLLRFASGLGEGALAAVSNAAIGNTQQPVRVYAISYIGQMSVASAFLFVIPELLGLWGPPAVFACIAFSAVCGTAVLRWFPARCETSERDTQLRFRAPVAPQVAGVLGTLCFFTTTGGVWAYVERMGIADGLSQQTIGRALATSSLVGVAAACIVSVAGGRIGIFRSYFCAVSIGIGSIALLMQDVTTASFTIAACLFVFAWNAAVPYLLEALAVSDPTGRLIAFGTALAYAGLMTGPMLAALIASGEDFRAVNALGIAGYLFSVALFMPLMRRSTIACSR